MDKRVIFAVAGSGKTTRIIDELDLERRVLLVTYTENNYAHLRLKILQKFGHFPQNITLRTYFTFLHSFCFRPLLQMTLRTKGVNFSMPPATTSRIPATNNARFIDGSGRLYHNRIAKLLDVKKCVPEIVGRVERYFDRVFVDEVQDFAGHDFNLLLDLCGAKTDVLLVGDFYQHTFDTSRDGPVNKRLHDSIEEYENRFAAKRIVIDKQSLQTSRRCSKSVCDFIREQLHIDIHSHRDRLTAVSVVDNAAEAAALYRDPNVVKLFYDRHAKYGCYSQNWGASKGMDHFDNVCVVLNETSWKQLHKGTLHELAPKTRNKLYVACSRARGDLFLVHDALFKKSCA
ncbi:AAA family ATPase [Cupriavidus sp. amp6]|uniref:AAA family ATPase n=1 Tax=Cupriavidus sp. amp6 TaxID=388051 RepID=UPI00048CDB20|nr:AAA family ATPase [Cupriavidus sp. amp6]